MTLPGLPRRFSVRADWAEPRAVPALRLDRRTPREAFLSGVLSVVSGAWLSEIARKAAARWCVKKN